MITYILSTIYFLPFNTCRTVPQTMIPVYITKSHIITYIPLETYVTGVVSSEMPSSFHIEALKAQAVASRTYAVARVRSDKNPSAHPLAPLCDSTHCQVYSDTEKISPKVKEAVIETASQLLYYDGELAKDTLYHASSGGHTENSEDVFVSVVPYLKSVESPYEDTFSRNGHGVGMSQHGANGMAKAGFDYKKILSHYYSGTVVY